MLSDFLQRMYTTKKTRFSNKFSQPYWQESVDGDSFFSQSRFYAYAVSNIYPFKGRGSIVVRAHAFHAEGLWLESDPMMP